MLGLFGKKDTKNSKGSTSYQISKNWTQALQDIKRQRAIFCQNKGMSINEMGKDLAHIERRAKLYFNTAITGLKEGRPAEEIYNELAANHVSSEIDRQILDSLFIKK